VTIVQGTSGYPSIAPGASASNDTDFIVLLSPSYVSRDAAQSCSSTSAANQGNDRSAFSLTRLETPGVNTIFQENFDSTTPGTLPAGWLIQHVGRQQYGFCGPRANTFNPGNKWGVSHQLPNDGNKQAIRLDGNVSSALLSQFRRTRNM